MMRRQTVHFLGILAIGTMILVAGCAKPTPRAEGWPEPPPQPPEKAPATERKTPSGEDRLDIENLSLSQLNRVVQDMGLLRDIHFDFDSYELRPDARAILRENATFLRDYPTLRIRVEGHCDERGTNEYNLALGEKRAFASKQFMERLGVASSRLATITYGEERPLDQGHNEAAWARNRRAHHLIVAK